MLFFSLGYDGTHAEEGGLKADRHSFSYFTILTYWGLAFYFLTSAIHTYGFARNGAPLLDRFPRPLQALHHLYYSTITTYPFIVTIVFWGLLYSGKWWALRFDAFTNISEHLLNSCFALFEVLMTRINPPPFVHIVWLIVILGGYLGVAYITYFTEGWYVYPFLNPADGPVLAAYIVGIAAAAIIFFSVINGMIRGRRWITEEAFNRSRKHRAGGPRDDEAAMEMASPTVVEFGKV